MSDDPAVREATTAEGPGPLASVDPSPGASKPVATLVVEGLRRRFGGLVAVDVAHLEVQRRAITALIGPNGAGKTTLFNLVTGFDRADEGTVELDGAPIHRRSASAIARRGLVRTFQLTRTLSRLTVLENLALAAPRQRGERLAAALWRPLWRGQERENEVRAEALLERFGLAHMRDEYAGTLSGGQRKLLEMARALMVEPRVVLLDEPMAGVNPALTETILGHVQELRAEGRTVVFIEHDMDVVREIADWVVCMANGAVISEGPPAVVGRDPAVIDAYLGSPAPEAAT